VGRKLLNMGESNQMVSVVIGDSLSKLWTS
jgi:hypothetical protein